MANPVLTYAMVKESLDAAIANGYDEMLKWEPIRIAEDMCDYDSDLQMFTPGELVPHIHRYVRENGDGPR